VPGAAASSARHAAGATRACSKFISILSMKRFDDRRDLARAGWFEAL
jgi:hypothetical protein